MGQLVDLESHRHVCDHRPEEGEKLADGQEPEVAVPSQRADIHRGESNDALPSNTRRRLRLCRSLVVDARLACGAHSQPGTAGRP